MLRDYACECRNARCRDRVYLTVSDYRAAAACGRVVSVDHVDGPLIRRTRTFAIVAMKRGELDHDAPAAA